MSTRRFSVCTLPHQNSLRQVLWILQPQWRVLSMLSSPKQTQHGKPRAAPRFPVCGMHSDD